MTRGPRPTSHTPWVSDLGCGKSEPPLAQVLRLLGAVVEDRRTFLKPMQRYRGAPCVARQNHQAWGATGQSAAGTYMAVGVTEGRLTVSASARTEATRQSSNYAMSKQSTGFGPTCRLASSPEVGSRATVSTLKQGYPLPQYEDAVPT
jgi:hypothetical protein